MAAAVAAADQFAGIGNMLPRKGDYFGEGFGSPLIFKE